MELSILEKAILVFVALVLFVVIIFGDYLGRWGKSAVKLASKSDKTDGLLAKREKGETV